MLSETGIPTAEDVGRVLPPKERLEKGPVAVIECFQKIPCDPCFGACPRGAIKEFTNINDLPHIDHDRCTGCGLCIARCPGLAIFTVDYSYSDKEAMVSIPYEFLPVPEEGEIVTGLDRSGRPVSPARVERVRSFKGEKTLVVSMAVPREHAMEIRFLRKCSDGQD